jgi:hypothetical protein
MTQALVERFAREYPTISREEITAAVEASLAQYTRDGLVFAASDVVQNVRLRLDEVAPVEVSDAAPDSPATYRSPKPQEPPKAPARGLLGRIWDCMWR